MDIDFYESEIRACKSLLADTDYIVLKKGEGYDMAKHADIFIKRDEWRKRIREMEEMLNVLDN